MKKRLLTWLLALCVGAGIVVCPVDGKVDVWAEELEEEVDTKANAQPSDQTYAEWKYRILDDDTAMISDYIGGKEKVTVPSEIVEPDGSKVAVTQLENVFYGNETIKEIIIPEGIKKIGAFAFKGCTNLKNITLPDSVTDIGKWAFDGCESLISITIPKGVTNMEYLEGGSSSSEGIFSGCSKLQEINVDLENPNYASVNGMLCNKRKDTLIAYPEGRTVLEIPATVTVLSDRIQHRISEFSSLQIESGNTSFAIENQILYGNNKSEMLYCLPGAKNVSSIVVPGGVTKIAADAFYEFHNLTSVTLPNGLQEIGNNAFAKCDNLKSVVLPEGLQVIGEGVFFDCASLESVTMPDSLSQIAPEAFKNCVKLAGVNLPSGLLRIGYGAFENCSSLTDITFPESLTSIGLYAFSGCNALKNIEVPKNVEFLHGNFGTAFSGENLESINVSESNPHYSSEDGILYDKEKTKLLKCPEKKKKVNIPESVKWIHDSAFSGCTKLQKVDLPSNLKGIGVWGFSGCTNLKGMIFPDSLTSIDYHVFSYCTNMRFVAIPISVTSIDNTTFTIYDEENNLKNLDVIIKCMKDSYAESYAKKYGFRYEVVDSFEGLIVEVKEEENPTENTDNKVESINLDKSALTFDTIGSSQKLTATVTPATQLSQVTWSTSNEKVATVKDGAVTAKGNGTATITASLGDKTAAATVTVSQKCKKVTMTLNGQTVNGTLKAKVGKTYNFKTIVTPQNADKKNAKITWATSNKKIATVKNGKVSVKKSGTVTITAKTADGKTTKIKLKAGKQKVKVSKVKITGNKTMKVKGKQTLDLTVTPATADNTKVSWSSSNKKIIAVDSKGKVTAKKKGTATITAKAKDGSGKKASFKIRVK